jgi:beta-N-acetylhexosaminidase
LQTKQRFGVLSPSLVDPQTAAKAVNTPEHQQLALEIAEQSITLLRDRGGLLPLRADEPLLVIEPAGSCGLAAALNATYLQVSNEPTNAEIKLALSMARDGRKVIVVTSDANRLTQQADLVNDLLAAGLPVIVIASRNPYDILAFPQVQTYLLSYGLNEPTIAALVSVLRGEFIPQGVLPVEIPGLSTR